MLTGCLPASPTSLDCRIVITSPECLQMHIVARYPSRSIIFLSFVVGDEGSSCILSSPWTVSTPAVRVGCPFYPGVEVARSHVVHKFGESCCLCGVRGAHSRMPYTLTADDYCSLPTRVRHDFRCHRPPAQWSCHPTHVTRSNTELAPTSGVYLSTTQILTHAGALTHTHAYRHTRTYTHTLYLHYLVLACNTNRLSRCIVHQPLLLHIH